MDYMDCEQILKDLDICGKEKNCMGCSQVENQAGEPDCYRIVMEQAAGMIRELLQDRKRMIDRDELVKALGVQIRTTITNNEGYVNGMIAASNVAQLMPAAGEERSREH